MQQKIDDQKATRRDLQPPLPELERSLFTPSDGLIHRWREGARLPPELAAALAADPEAGARREALQQAEQHPFAGADGLPAPAPSARLLARFAAREAARRAVFSPVPTAGQILRVDEARGPAGPLGWDLPRPLAVLIAEPTETPQVWYGWLVTAETDYASYWDFLLGPEDEPCDPIARLVQLWNPVHIYLPSISLVLAELKPERLAAVRALAAECAAAPEPESVQAQPGVIITRQAGPYRIRTGTPLGDARDPRRRYQQLYYAYAAAIREPAALAAQATPLLERIAHALRDWAAAVGAALHPYVPVPEPMGKPPDAEAVRCYQLDHLIRLQLETDETNQLLRLRLENLAGVALRIQLREDSELMHSAPLPAAGPPVELTANLARTVVLLIADEAGDIRWEMPLGVD